MKLTNIKTLSIIIIGGILISVLVIIIIIRKNEKNLDSPISQTSFSSSFPSLTKEGLSLTGVTKWVENEKYFLFEVDNAVQLEKVKQLAGEKGYKLIYSKEGSIYNWKVKDRQIIYDLSTNILTIFGNDVLAINSSESVTAETFSKLVNKQFNLNLKYELFQTSDGSNGEKVYYLKRLLDEKNLVEMDNPNQQTDLIALKNGKVIYAKLLLTQFVKTEKIVPLLSKTDLEKYINQPTYPKAIIPNLEILSNEPEYKQMAYSEKEWNKIYRSFGNCEVDKISVVYLFKMMSQEYLTPVFRLEGQCKIVFKEKDFFVPSIWYVNAITPELISTEK